MARKFLDPIGLPVVTTAQRDALSGAAAGWLVWNSDTVQVEKYGGSGWTALGTGSTGAAGPPGGFSMAFDSTTTMADPGQGKVRFNNATQNLATAIVFDDLDVNAVSIRTAMSYMAYGGALATSFIIFYKASDPTHWMVISTVGSSYSLPTGYTYLLSLVVQAASSSSPFTNGDSIVMQPFRGSAPGNDGAPGADGATAIFGDASDGVIDFDGTTARLGLTPSSGIYTLTRDIYLDNGSQISGTGSIATAGFRILCAGAFIIGAGRSVNSLGKTGSGATAGAAVPAGSIQINSGAGGAGGVAVAGTAGANQTNTVGGAGGAGGAASGGGVGGGPAGGTATAPTAVLGGVPRSWWQASIMRTLSSVQLVGGAGGGGGTAVTSSTGGGGGGGGGIVWIAAKLLMNSGSISVKGGDGRAAAGSGTGAGGGGSGGGGCIMLIVGAGSTVGSTDVTAGSGGALQGAGRTGAAGSSGQVITINV
jgi:hypothetical protein